MSSIPSELTARRQWVVWRYEKRDGKSTKVPYQACAPTNRGAASGTVRKRPASTTDPSTWRSFQEAAIALRDGPFDGIGYVFSEHDPFCGVDFDKCVADDETHPDVAGLVLTLDSYTEHSPSGTGLHVIVRAEHGKGRRTSKTSWGGEFEVYDRTRYFAFTGHHVTGQPTTVNDRQRELEEVLAEVWPPQPATVAAPRSTGTVSFDDRDLLDKASAASNGASFDALWRGDLSGYGSASEADLALCNHLAFWTGGDPARIDSLFRQSGLMRDKWDREDYRDRTIAKALEGRTEFYTPGGGCHLGVPLGGVPSGTLPETPVNTGDSGVPTGVPVAPAGTPSLAPLSGTLRVLDIERMLTTSPPPVPWTVEPILAPSGA